MLNQLSDWMTNHNFSGVVLVAHKKRILLCDGYGYANNSTDELNQSDTAFCIASVTKMFTAVALLQLQERGVLQVSDSLHQYIPDYPRGREITIHHLLSMTSGIAPLGLSYEQMSQPIDLGALVETVKENASASSPGASFCYNNANYTLLAYIIEKASGLSYAAYLQQHIFMPLGMCNSYVDDGIARPEDAQGTERYHISWAAGSGNVRSTVQDLYLFDQALHAGVLINADSWRCMQTPIAQTGWNYWSQKGSSYGYGLIIAPATHNRDCVVGHAGGTGGFSAHFFHFVTNDITMIVLSNDDAFDAFAQDFLHELEGFVFQEI